MDNETDFTLAESSAAGGVEFDETGGVDHTPTVELTHIGQTQRREENAKRGKAIKKKAGKATLFGLDNLDSLLGGSSYALVISAYNYFRLGDYLTAGLLSALWILAVIAKKRVGEGPISKAMKMPLPDLKTKLVDVTKTIYKG